MKVTRKVHTTMKKGSKGRAEYNKDVQYRSYESKVDGPYETANKEEREKLINLGNL